MWLLKPQVPSFPLQGCTPLTLLFEYNPPSLLQTRRNPPSNHLDLRVLLMLFTLEHPLDICESNSDDTSELGDHLLLLIQPLGDQELFKLHLYSQSWLWAPERPVGLPSLSDPLAMSNSLCIPAGVGLWRLCIPTGISSTSLSNHVDTDSFCDPMDTSPLHALALLQSLCDLLVFLFLPGMLQAYSWALWASSAEPRRYSCPFLWLCCYSKRSQDHKRSSAKVFPTLLLPATLLYSCYPISTSPPPGSHSVCVVEPTAHAIDFSAILTTSPASVTETWVHTKHGSLLIKVLNFGQRSCSSHDLMTKQPAVYSLKLAPRRHLKIIEFRQI